MRLHAVGELQFNITVNFCQDNMTHCIAYDYIFSWPPKEASSINQNWSHIHTHTHTHSLIPADILNFEAIFLKFGT